MSAVNTSGANQRLTKAELTALTEKFVVVTNDLLAQIQERKATLTKEERYFIGLLVRQRTILGDAAEILRTNHETHLTSVFVLFRVLLDDFIRLFGVYAAESDRREEVVDLMNADAWKHRFLRWEEDVKINEGWHGGEHVELTSRSVFEKHKEDFLANPENAHYLKDKTQFSFKSLPPIQVSLRNVCQELGARGNVGAYAAYKKLSEYVHYAEVFFQHERNLEYRSSEMWLLGNVVLVYVYKSLIMHWRYFQAKHPDLELRSGELAAWFDLQTSTIGGTQTTG